MGGGAGKGLAGIVLRGGEVTSLLSLKKEDPVGKNLRPGQLPPDAGGHGAQVLSDNQGMPALALQSEETQKVPGRIAHVRPFLGPQALRNPIEAKKPHDMVNPDNTTGRQIGPEGVNKKAVA